MSLQRRSRSRVAAWSAVALWVVAPALLVLSLYRPFGASRGRAASLPTQLEGYEQVQAYDLTRRQLDLLGTDDATWRVYRDADGNDVYLIAVFHQENWKSVHPPDICLRGSDMVIRENGTLAIGAAASPIVVGRILTHQRPTQRDYLSLYVYGADGMVTSSYSEFVIHHAPLALLRRAIRGYLLRVETYVGPGGVAAAERRCGGFLLRMLSRANAALAGG